MHGGKGDKNGREMGRILERRWREKKVEEVKRVHVRGGGKIGRRRRVDREKEGRLGGRSEAGVAGCEGERENEEEKEEEEEKKRWKKSE